MEASFSKIDDFSALGSSDFNSSFLGDNVGKYNENDASASADYGDMAGNAKRTVLSRHLDGAVVVEDSEDKYAEMKDMRGKSKKSMTAAFKKQVTSKKGSGGAGAFPLI
jgi:hypothetical protein